MLSIGDEVTDTVSVDRGRTIRKDGHVRFISEIAEGIFVHRHYQRDTRDISVADDLEVVADAHIELKKRTKAKRAGVNRQACLLSYS